ncbi:MAG: RidA family protein [Frankiales bacterium]|nr:RidA family protein [Frankiales bacterium]
MRQNIASGGPYEVRFGYTRAVAVGGHLWVSGCTSVVDGVVTQPGDAAGQAQAALDNALDAVARAGFDRGDVVRTRMYVVDLAVNGVAVADTHGRVFGEVRPASSLLGVAALVDPAMLVEIEVECFRETS